MLFRSNSGVARAQAGLQALSGVDLKELFSHEWPRLKRTLSSAKSREEKRAAVHAIRGSLAVLGHSPELKAAKLIEETLLDGVTPSELVFAEFVRGVEKMLTLSSEKPG